MKRLFTVLTMEDIRIHKTYYIYAETEDDALDKWAEGLEDPEFIETETLSVESVGYVNNEDDEI